MQKSYAFIIWNCLIFFCCPNFLKAQKDSVQANSFTAGWMPDKGKAKFIPYYSLYSASSFKDLEGEFTNYQRNGRFLSHGLRLYNEYGLEEGMALVTVLPFLNNTYREDSFSQTNFNLSDIEIGIRKYFLNLDTNYHLMGQATALFPFYSNAKNPVTGLGKTGVELKVIFGGSIKRYQYKPFIKAEFAFRQFINGPPQVLYQALLGYNLSATHQLNIEASGTASYGTSALFDQSNVAINQRFAFHKLTFNYGLRISPAVSIYAGVFRDFANWNTGIGRGGQFFLVVNI